MAFEQKNNFSHSSISQGKSCEFFAFEQSQKSSYFQLIKNIETIESRIKKYKQIDNSQNPIKPFIVTTNILSFMLSVIALHLCSDIPLFPQLMLSLIFILTECKTRSFLLKSTTLAVRF